jgi:hypothetical protein
MLGARETDGGFLPESGISEGRLWVDGVEKGRLKRSLAQWPNADSANVRIGGWRLLALHTAAWRCGVGPMPGLICVYRGKRWSQRRGRKRFHVHHHHHPAWLERRRRWTSNCFASLARVGGENSQSCRFHSIPPPAGPIGVAAMTNARGFSVCVRNRLGSRQTAAMVIAVAALAGQAHAGLYQPSFAGPALDPSLGSVDEVPDPQTG